MKKMYEKTVRGYYVMSVMLGLLLALSVATMLEVAVMDAIRIVPDRMNAFLDDVWGICRRTCVTGSGGRRFACVI